jgi:hypothetical protein
MPFISVESING